MARTNKTGIDYFPIDVDFFQDEKIQFVSARFGLKGEAIAIRLLCKIYRNGYYTEWNDDTALLFAKGVGDGCSDACVKDVVHELLKRGFFDKSIFERFSILTSKGIQNRYFEATRRYNSVDVFEEFLLVDVSKFNNVNIINKNVNINNKNDDINSQKKREREREEKEKENKKNNVGFSEWKNDFNSYLSCLYYSYQILITDEDWILQQEKFNPNVDILLTLEKACTNFWGTEAGWKHKKKGKTEQIDWKQTFTNAISLPANKVYKSKEQNGIQQKSGAYEKVTNQVANILERRYGTANS